MQLYNNTFDSFSSVNYIIANLNRAINTSYIPSGNDIQEVISNFTKIQLQRSFNPNCGGQADLEMTFNEKHLLVSYTSTSGTSVNIWYIFNNNMEVEKIEVSVWLPDDRAQSGRCHYETLTQELYRYNFIKTDWENKTAEIELPYDLHKLNQDSDWNLADNIPNWVYEAESNYHAVWFPQIVVTELLELGYTPINLVSYKAGYYNRDAYYQYVVVYEKYHQCDNNYYLLQDSDSKLDFNLGGVSYKRLLELLENSKDKEQRRSRRSNRTSDIVIEQDTEIEDYDYNDNDIDYVDDEE